MANGYARYSGFSGSGGGGGGGTVTSVGFADGSTIPIFGISGSPVTTSGTITAVLVEQSANTVFAGPASGGNDSFTHLLLHFNSNLLDSSANNNSVSQLPGASSYVAGEFSNAIDVSGGGAPYVSTGLASGIFDFAAGDFTIDCWFKTAAVPSSPILAVNINSNGD